MMKQFSKAPVTAQNSLGFVLNVRPQSLVDPVVPPGYGFAILSQDGKVLFHSEEGLSLQENFFDEIGDAETVREQARSEQLYIWSGEYHGHPHRILMRPMSQVL